MAKQSNKFFNVILCEDVREEVGNKKSIMGVFGGDVLVSKTPATVQIAFYMQYLPGGDEKDEIEIQFRIMTDEEELLKARLRAPTKAPPLTLVIPRGLATFDKECALRLLVTVDGGDEVELLSKRIINMAKTSTASEQPASQSPSDAPPSS